MWPYIRLTMITTLNASSLLDRLDMLNMANWPDRLMPARLPKLSTELATHGPSVLVRHWSIRLLFVRNLLRRLRNAGRIIFLFRPWQCAHRPSMYRLMSFPRSGLRLLTLLTSVLTTEIMPPAPLPMGLEVELLLRMTLTGPMCALALVSTRTTRLLNVVVRVRHLCLGLTMTILLLWPRNTLVTLRPMAKDPLLLDALSMNLPEPTRSCWLVRTGPLSWVPDLQNRLRGLNILRAANGTRTVVSPAARACPTGRGPPFSGSLVASFLTRTNPRSLVA